MNQIISAQIKSAESDSTHLLQVQNHIYGCFVLMEDIAEGNIVLNNNEFKRTNYTFDIDQQFAEIGIRYGFIMDTKLLMTSCLPEYKNAWLQIFKTKQTLEEVDKLEDSIIDIIKTHVLPEMAFFLHALETGSLPQEWINKVIKLLLPSIAVKEPPVVKESPAVKDSPMVTEPKITESKETEPEAEEPIVKSIISAAKMEKPKKFRITKRNPVVVTKVTGPTFLRETRRSKMQSVHKK